MVRLIAFLSTAMCTTRLGTTIPNRACPVRELLVNILTGPEWNTESACLSTSSYSYGLVNLWSRPNLHPGELRRNFNS